MAAMCGCCWSSPATDTSVFSKDTSRLHASLMTLSKLLQIHAVNKLLLLLIRSVFYDWNYYLRVMEECSKQINVKYRNTMHL